MPTHMGQTGVEPIRKTVRSVRGDLTYYDVKALVRNEDNWQFHTHGGRLISILNIDKKIIR